MKTKSNFFFTQVNEVASKKKDFKNKEKPTKDVCRVLVSALPPQPLPDSVDLEPSHLEEVDFLKCLL